MITALLEIKKVDFDELGTLWLRFPRAKNMVRYPSGRIGIVTHPDADHPQGQHVFVDDEVLPLRAAVRDIR